MPELPEVETIKRGLLRLVVGKKVIRVSSDTPKSFPNPESEVERFLVGATITNVHRRAKVLIIDLSSDYSLVAHLKMTGQIIVVQPPTSRHSGPDPEPSQKMSRSDLEVSLDSVIEGERWGGGHPNDSLTGSLPDKSTRVEITFDDGSHLYFNDQRKFGWMRLLPTISVSKIDFMKKVGPEPLEDDFTGDVLFERLQRRKNTTIKAAILDQTVLAGVGNIYADESLWGARIHPATLVKNISKSDIIKFAQEIKKVMTLSIEKGGSTDRNYVDAEGKKGSYLAFARVFRREGEPCPRCGTTIIKTRVAARGTHLCPHCQTMK